MSKTIYVEFSIEDGKMETAIELLRYRVREIDGLYISKVEVKG